MPIYDYLCDSCGPFTEMRPMAEYETPCECPVCNLDAPRSLSVPHFANMAPERRHAFATNERSAHAPQSSTEYKSRHGANCSCCTGKGSRFTARAKDGSKSFPTSRPWMISH
ncbi:MAG: zinc ribbon domain-containing protein [Alphaproteobacteria bacterium]